MVLEKTFNFVALLYLHDKITSAIDERKHTVGIFLDLSKAFDTVNRRILLDKLDIMGFVVGLALEWIKCYLSKRHQHGEFNGILSSFHEISGGVPQGSVLGPLFFLIYVSDLCQISNIYDLVLFADDTNLFFSHFDFPTLMNLINFKILKLSDWFKANKLSLNIQKPNYIISKPRQTRNEFTLNIEMNGFKMNQIKEVNFLGVILDETLSWKLHISQVASKVSKSVGVIRKSSFCLTGTALCTLYYSLIYSYLQHCILVWVSIYPTHLRRLVLLQKRIVIIISKKGFDAHIDPLFKNLMILKLQDIYSLHLAKIMFSFKNNSSFSRSILRTNQVHGYNKCQTNCEVNC